MAGCGVAGGGRSVRRVCPYGLDRQFESPAIPYEWSDAPPPDTDWRHTYAPVSAALVT